MPMEEFNAYSPEDIIAANLQELSAHTDALWEQRMTHLCELAVQIAEDIGQDNEFFHILSDHRPPRHVPNAARRLVSAPSFEMAHTERLSTADSVYLCRELCRILEERPDWNLSLFFPEAEILSEAAAGVIAYQHSTYADSAYLTFAAALPSPRARYAHSFTEICEDVYNGFCEYCILPLESSAEGQLTGFSRLIDRYELKIVATCDIPATDGRRSTRFALLRRDLVPLPSEVPCEEMFFEFSTGMEDRPSVAELLSAANLCGLTLYRLDCRASAEEDEAEQRVHCVFRVGHGDLIAFWLYLSMEAPHCEPSGIYIHLNNNKRK